MKKIIILILATFITHSAIAASDSVAVFHRPEKVVVLINEAGESGRLHDLMNALGKENSFIAQSADESIKIQCGRITDAASCTFRFFPGTGILISEKSLKARTLLTNLGLESENFEMLFESSREDKFVLKIIDGNINFFASKKSL
ncbi:hypothetical protein SHI21_00025 [Bacteriovorax sp. PP10]|uniref:Uncharacterized protein n=1 Tax=Bacteriovorax antarcticus TaxID=3088717 RepID=A0ABU5VNQ0_9BACT|nr:hypothetical protein [Bacteriovorax sp. PP10]MEA9354567.1 hypothetical protein [Bacteriovorax sp. PP10]